MDIDFLNKVHPECRDFVVVVEELLGTRREELADGTLSFAHSDNFWGPRTWVRTEMEDMVYSSYKQMRRGRITRNPKRDVVMDIADYLNCTIAERNRLLQAAGYAPIDIYLTGERLDALLQPAIQIARSIESPAMVLNRDWRIHFLNDAMLVLYDISSKQFDAVPPKYRNGIRMLFDPYLPLYNNLIDKPNSWQRMVRRTLYGFKMANRLCEFEDWYQELVAEWMELPNFAQQWGAVRVDVPYGEDNSAMDMPSVLVLDTAIPRLKAEGRRASLRPVLISVGYFQHDFPQILALLPVDEEARLTLLEVGAIPA